MSASNPCLSLGQGCGSATNFPQFVDSAACLCGLLTSREAPFNGESIEDWRCIGDGSANLESGGNGKWYNTTLPSQELSGINQPQNWAQNPPDLSQAYVLADVNGKPTYQKLGSNGSPQLIGNDTKCTGKNDTNLSGIYYSKGKNAAHSGSSSMMPSSTSAMMSMSSMMSASSASSMSMSSASSTASSTSSSTSSSPSPSSTAKASEASYSGLKAVMLVGMLLTPLVAMMA